MKVGINPLTLFSNDLVKTFVLPISAVLDSAWLEVMIHKGGNLLPRYTVTVLWNFKLHLPPGHAGFLVSRDHHGLSIIIKISVPSGVSFWFIPLGPARLIAEDEKSFKWIMQEGENM